MKSRWTTSSQLPQAPQRSRLLQSLSRHQSQFPPLSLLPLRSRPLNLLPSLLQRRSPHQSRPIRLVSPHRNLFPLPNLHQNPLQPSRLQLLPIRSRNLHPLPSLLRNLHQNPSLLLLPSLSLSTRLLSLLPSPLPLPSLLRNLFLPIRSQNLLLNLHQNPLQPNRLQLLPIRSRNLLLSPPTRSQSPLRKLLLSPYPPSRPLSRLLPNLVPLMLLLSLLQHPLQSLLLSTRSQSPRRKTLLLLLPRRLVSLLQHPLPSLLLPTRSASLRLPSPRQNRPLPKKGRRSRLPRYTSPLRSPRPPDRRANRSLNRSPIRRRG